MWSCLNINTKSVKLKLLKDKTTWYVFVYSASSYILLGSFAKKDKFISNIQTKTIFSTNR